MLKSLINRLRTDKIIKSIRNADEDDDAIGFAVFDNNGKLIFHDNENGKDFKYQDVVGKFVNQQVDGDAWRLVWLKSADGNYNIAVGQELEYREDMAWDVLEEFMVPWAAGLITLLVMMILVTLKHAILRIVTSLAKTVLFM